ncbi:MAG TPA: DHH family phosphoesterase [Opitutales bacterium]|nr:DHH family phosphoesterase [Opitutales bacterium]
MYFPQHSPEFRLLIDGLHNRPVAVMGHLRPDGDCVGSQVALTRMLRALGVDAVAVNHDPVPRLLAEFVGDTPWKLAADYTPVPGTLGITVDCADLIRVGPRLRDFFPKPFLAVDHHASNDGFAENNFILPATSATAEVLAGFAFDTDLPVDAPTAQALYVGIATDTGQFRFPSTTPQVFQLCAQLTTRGADPGAAAQLLFERESLGKTRLLRAFLNSLHGEFGSRVCVGTLRDADFAATGAQREDTEGLVDYARAIEGVDVGVLLEERKGATKGSLRAKNARFALHRLAQRLGGGGHACAAGFNVNEPLDQFYPRFLGELKKHLAAVDQAAP